MHVFTFGGLSLSSLTICWWGGPVVQGGEGNGWLVLSDGVNMCRVG